MRPTSFSATSLQTAEGCLSRYHAEVIVRGRGETGEAATVGLICHDTLEHYVRGTQIKKDIPWGFDSMVKLFDASYERVLGSDRDRAEYADARSIVLKWLGTEGREEYFNNVRVVSLEAKNNFPIPVMVTADDGTVSKEIIPVNYIMDRVDKLGDKEYRIVDYKTNRVPLAHDALRNKIQARLYALALQIIYKDAERIWVEFDFLRHDSVGVVLTKEDSADTWRMLKRATQRIIDTSDHDAERAETINADCVWCVKKTTCKALQQNAAAGGIHSLDVPEAAKRLDRAKAQAKALDYLQSELEDYLLKQLMVAGTIDLDLEEVRVRLKRSSRRSVDSRAVAGIIGPALSAELGSFTVGNLDELIKSGRLDAEQVARVRAAISSKLGDPKIDVTVKKG
jgi:hypothetical protein